MIICPSCFSQIKIKSKFILLQIYSYRSYNYLFPIFSQFVSGVSLNNLYPKKTMNALNFIPFLKKKNNYTKKKKDYFDLNSELFFHQDFVASASNVNQVAVKLKPTMMRRNTRRFRSMHLEEEFES